MKKHLLIGASILAFGITTTAIYAQVTGTSVVDKMKAVAHSFTLATTLNPSDTGLTSDPVKGKKTGDILTAGEWNRVLELVSEGGTGGGSGWVDVPLNGTEDFDSSCAYRYKLGATGANSAYIGTSPYFFANAVDAKQLTWWIGDQSAAVHHISSSSKAVYRINGVVYAPAGGISKIEKLCGGGGSSGTGSQVASRAAAVRASGHPLAIPSGIIDWPDSIVCDGYGGWAGGTESLSLDLTGTNVVGYTQSEGIGVFFDPSTGVLSRADRVGACGASNIATICAAGRCVYGGGASVAGGLSMYKCTNAQSMDSTNAPCYGASRNGGAGTSQYRVVSCTDNDGTRSYTMSSILNFGQLITNKWAVSVNGGTIECDDGTVLVMATQGGGSSGSSASTWVDVSLTDTADFDASCDYKVTMNYIGSTGNSVWMGASSGSHLAAGVSTKFLSFVNGGTAIFGIRSTNKNQYGYKDLSGTFTLSPEVQNTKLQKRCQ